MATYKIIESVNELYNNVDGNDDILSDIGGTDEIRMGFTNVPDNNLNEFGGDSLYSHGNDIGGDGFPAYNNNDTSPSIENDLKANTAMYNEDLEYNHASDATQDEYVISEDYLGTDVRFDDEFEIFRNPKSLKNLKPDIKGLIDMSTGDFYVANYGKLLHIDIARWLNEKLGLHIPTIWKELYDASKFLAVQRRGRSNLFGLSEVYYYEEYDMNPEKVERITSAFERTQQKNSTVEFTLEDAENHTNEPQNEPQNEPELASALEERVLSAMKGSSSVEVKDKCRLGGGTTCNQGDIKNFKINTINEMNGNDPKDFWAWVSPQNQLIKVGTLKHQGYIMRVYKDAEFGWDYDRVFDQALKDGWVRVIYEYNSNTYSGELAINGDTEQRVKSVFKSMFLDLVKYGRNYIYLEWESPERNWLKITTGDAEGRKQIDALEESVNPLDVNDNDSSLDSIIEGRRSVGTYVTYGRKDVIMKLEDYGVNILPITKNPHGLLIIFNDRGRNNALRLWKYADTKGGYLKDETPEEAAFIGGLLEYSDESIGEYINNKYNKTSLNEGYYDTDTRYVGVITPEMKLIKGATHNAIFKQLFPDIDGYADAYDHAFANGYVRVIYSENTYNNQTMLHANFEGMKNDLINAIRKLYYKTLISNRSSISIDIVDGRSFGFILPEQKQEFNAFMGGLTEGVGDKYVERRFNMRPEFDDFEQLYRNKLSSEGQDEVVYDDTDKGGTLKIIKNPKTLSSIGANVRGVIDKEGNFYTEQRVSGKVHVAILGVLEELKLIPENWNWTEELPTDFITVMRSKDENAILLGESNEMMTPPEERDPNYYGRGYWESFPPYEEAVKAFQRFIDAAKAKNPNINFINENIIYYEGSKIREEFEEQQINLNEYPQQMEKAYGKTGLYDKEDMDAILSITGGDPYTKWIADVFYYLANRYNKKLVTPTKLSERNRTILVDAHKRIKRYDKNVLPIHDLYAQEHNAHALEKMNDLRTRELIIERLKEFPSILLRNLRADIRVERDHYELDLLFQTVKEIQNLLTLLDRVKPENREKIYKKVFSSANDTFDDIKKRLDNTTLPYLSQDLEREDIIEKVDDMGNEAQILYDGNNILVVKIMSADAMGYIGCSSQWCFASNPNQYWDDYTNQGFATIVFNFNEPESEPNRMVVVLEDGSVYNMYNDYIEDGYAYLNDIGVNDVINRDVKDYAEIDEHFSKFPRMSEVKLMFKENVDGLENSSTFAAEIPVTNSSELMRENVEIKYNIKEARQLM